MVWDWGLLERELNVGHVELLQLKAHEREAPRTLQRACSGGIGRYCVRGPTGNRPLEMGME